MAEPLPRPDGQSASRQALMRARNGRIAAAAQRHKFDRDAAIPFLCECDLDGCEELMRLTLAEYTAARDAADHLVAPGHQIDGAKLVRVRDGCWLYRMTN